MIDDDVKLDREVMPAAATAPLHEVNIVPKLPLSGSPTPPSSAGGYATPVLAVPPVMSISEIVNLGDNVHTDLDLDSTDGTRANSSQSDKKPPVSGRVKRSPSMDVPPRIQSGKRRMSIEKRIQENSAASNLIIEKLTTKIHDYKEQFANMVYEYGILGEKHKLLESQTGIKRVPGVSAEGSFARNSVVGEGSQMSYHAPNLPTVPPPSQENAGNRKPMSDTVDSRPSGKHHHFHDASAQEFSHLKKQVEHLRHVVVHEMEKVAPYVLEKHSPKGVVTNSSMAKMDMKWQIPPPVTSKSAQTNARLHGKKLGATKQTPKPRVTKPIHLKDEVDAMDKLLDVADRSLYHDSEAAKESLRKGGRPHTAVQFVSAPRPTRPASTSGSFSLNRQRNNNHRHIKEHVNPASDAVNVVGSSCSRRPHTTGQSLLGTLQENAHSPLSPKPGTASPRFSPVRVTPVDSVEYSDSLATEGGSTRLPRDSSEMAGHHPASPSATAGIIVARNSGDFHRSPMLAGSMDGCEVGEKLWEVESEEVIATNGHPSNPPQGSLLQDYDMDGEWTAVMPDDGPGHEVIAQGTHPRMEEKEKNNPALVLAMQLKQNRLAREGKVLDASAGFKY